jgi:hypothetical protein
MPEHEIRVALVMNCGVRLEVWMGDVAHELDPIRLATTPGAPAAQPYDPPVADRWSGYCVHPVGTSNVGWSST